MVILKVQIIPETFIHSPYASVFGGLHLGRCVIGGSLCSLRCSDGILWVKFKSKLPSMVNYRKTLVVFELELIQTQMAQKPMLRAEVGMRVRCANKASAE